MIKYPFTFTKRTCEYQEGNCPLGKINETFFVSLHINSELTVTAKYPKGFCDPSFKVEQQEVR